MAENSASDTTTGGNEQLDLPERHRERFDRIKEECTDDYAPPPSDVAILKSLMDTWDAVDRGHYDTDN